jgi:hypothetical protein
MPSNRDGGWIFVVPARPKELLTMMPDNECTGQRPIGFEGVDKIVTAAMWAGWPMRSAFECALQLLCHGVSVAEAEEMFERCRRWRQ